MPTDERTRSIRVFISSTFRDMQAEREELVKRVFPELRRRCEERGVAWSEVDLRWGVTDEEKAEGAVLPICLAEIERSRPYFIGLIGDRYGWIPDEIDVDLRTRESWLDGVTGRSVTELEILHGVLNDPTMAGHAFFYLRDPAWARSQPAEEQATYLEAAIARRAVGARARGGRGPSRRPPPAARRPQGPDPRQRLPRWTATPTRWRWARRCWRTSAPWSTSCSRPISRRIRSTAPSPSTRPTPLLASTSTSAATPTEPPSRPRGRRRAAPPRGGPVGHRQVGAPGHLGRPRWRRRPGAPWWSPTSWGPRPRPPTPPRCRGASSARSAAGTGTAVDPDELPSDPDALRAALTDALRRAGEQRPVVLVLDGLDQLDDRDHAPDLAFLPVRAPGGRAPGGLRRGSAARSTPPWRAGWATHVVSPSPTPPDGSWWPRSSPGRPSASARSSPTAWWRTRAPPTRSSCARCSTSSASTATTSPSAT